MPDKSLPATPLIVVRHRRRRREEARRGVSQRTGRLAFGVGFLITAAGVILVLAAAFTYASLTSDLPPVEWLEALLDPSTGLLLQPTRIYDRTGAHLLGTLAPEDASRLFIPYEEFPQTLVDATLALLQPDFWDSPGYAISGWQDPASHPTLAQQLASDFLLADEISTSRRAVRERLLAAQVTALYGREQVVAWYLNSVDYGNYAYGAEAAARLYFGKSVTRLSLSEAAMLAAVGRTPALNPFDAPQAADANRVDTLGVLLSLGWITPDEALAAGSEVPVIISQPEAAESLVSGQFVDLVLRQLDTALGVGRVERGGALIHTSIDYDLQLQADCSLRTQLSRLAGDSGIVSAADGSACDATALLPALVGAAPVAQVVAGALILDPTTGQVLAASGDLSSHPSGTTITPFIYLNGFARGLNPSSLGWDIPGDEPAIGQVYHGPVRLRVALANDYLPPAVTILGQMGVESIRLTAASFGLDFPSTGLLEEDFALSPFDLASAYAILAAEGVQIGQDVIPLDPLSSSPLPGALPDGQRLETAAVLQVAYSDGSLWLDWTAPETRLVVTPELAYLLTHILSDEPARWPSLGRSNSLEIGRPVAVKAARTLDETGAWTVGYTPQRVVVTYLSGAGSKSRLAADGLWSALTRFAVQGLPTAGWEMPAGIVTLKVCDPSGLLPTRACPDVVDEVFLEGRQPVQYDTLYQAFEINIETGLLATVFTPPDLVESRVYMVAPPQARQWAEAAGIESPPTTYDYYQTPAILPDVHITTPAMFANVSGALEIRGTAAGEDFISYRLEYGSGLNPVSWYLLDADGSQPVTEGSLATWDTSGLDGLYSLRLMVVRTKNRVDEAVVQLTLDNTPPTVLIFFPEAGQELSLSEFPQAALQAQVQDAFLDEVVFYLDGVKLGSLSTPPFGVIWKAKTGLHVLRVTATDRAGNVAQAELRFTVKK
jgi:membrane carboxypeptidase/penicillin-binding protein